MSQASASNPFHFAPIGTVRTPFTEKFGIPRQPGLVAQAKGVLKLNDHPFLRQACASFEGFSHVWVIFVFHRHDARNWKPTIRPPRLGGKERVGVLASRSPHRPNPIGLSACRIERLDLEAPGGPEIHLIGVDLLDGTPVLDIKPYLPYADSIPEATSGWASTPIQRYEVRFSDEAETQLQHLAESDPDQFGHLRDFIIELLELDPRPAFQQRKRPVADPSTESDRYGFRVGDYDVKWRVVEGAFKVDRLEALAAGEASQNEEA